MAIEPDDRAWNRFAAASAGPKLPVPPNMALSPVTINPATAFRRPQPPTQAGVPPDDLLKLQVGAAAPGGLPRPEAPPNAPYQLELDGPNYDALQNIKKNAANALPTFNSPYEAGQSVRRGVGYAADAIGTGAGVVTRFANTAAGGPLRMAAGMVAQPAGRFARGLFGITGANDNQSDNVMAGYGDPRAATQNAVNAAGTASDDSMQGQSPYIGTAGGVGSGGGAPAAPIQQRNYAADFLGRDTIRGSLNGRPTTAGTQITSNYGYGDNITATADSRGRLNSFSNIGSPEVGRTTPAGAVGGPLQTGLVQSQYNTMPQSGVASLDPGTRAALHEAQLAAVGRGESLGGGTVAGYDDGGSSAAIGSLQGKLAVMDRDISSARDGTLVGNWKAGKLARDRDAIAARGAQLIGEQNAVNTGRNYAANTQSVANTAAMHDATLRRSAELGYGANMAQVGAQVRGQDRLAGTALMQDATHRADAKMRNDLGIANVGVHQRQNEINAAIHGPAAQMEALRLRYAQAGDMDSLEALSKATGKIHEGSGQYSPTKDLMGEVTGNFNKRDGEATKFMTEEQRKQAALARQLQK